MICFVLPSNVFVLFIFNGASDFVLMWMYLCLRICACFCANACGFVLRYICLNRFVWVDLNVCWSVRIHACVCIFDVCAPVIIFYFCFVFIFARSCMYAWMFILCMHIHVNAFSCFPMNVFLDVENCMFYTSVSEWVYAYCCVALFACVHVCVYVCVCVCRQV